MQESNKSIVRIFLVAGTAWAGFAMFLGLLNQLQLAFQWPGSDSALSYGIIRPLFTHTLFFGSILSFGTAIGYYILSGISGVELKATILAKAGFYIHNVGVGISAIAILFGFNKGREYGEGAWIGDGLVILSIIIFLSVFLKAVKGASAPGILASLVTLTAGAGLITIIIGNAAAPFMPLSSVPLTSGMQDAAVEGVYRSGLLAFVLVLPAFIALYKIVPEYYRVSLHSDSSPRFQAIALVCLAPIAGAAYLAFSPAPAQLQTIGIIAAVAIGSAVLAGTVNVFNTVHNNTVPLGSNNITKFLTGGAYLAGIYAVLRAIGSFRFMQERFAFTWLNFADISIDAATYGLIIFFGAGYVIVQKVKGQALEQPLVRTHMFLALIGAIVILVGNIFSGVAESSALRSIPESGQPATWAQAMLAGSLGQASGSLAVEYLVSPRGIVFIGYLLSAIGSWIGSVLIIHTFYFHGENYSEVNLHLPVTEKPATVAHGAH